MKRIILTEFMLLSPAEPLIAKAFPILLSDSIEIFLQNINITETSYNQ